MEVFILSPKNDPKLQELSETYFDRPIELLVEKYKDTLVTPQEPQQTDPKAIALPSESNQTGTSSATKLEKLTHEHFDKPFELLIAKFPEAPRPSTIKSDQKADNILANLGVNAPVNIPPERLEPYRDIEQSIQNAQTKLIQLEAHAKALLDPLSGNSTCSPQLKVQLESYLKKVPEVKNLFVSVRRSLVQSVLGLPQGSLLELPLNLSDLANDWKSDYASKANATNLELQTTKTKSALQEALKSLNELKALYHSELKAWQNSKLDPKSHAKIEGACKTRMKEVITLTTAIISPTGQSGLLHTLNAILEVFLPTSVPSSRESDHGKSHFRGKSD